MKKNALLASDMDGTVIPLDSKKERAAEIEEFNSLIKRHDHIALAYVTGRHLELGLAGVDHYRLPTPDIFVCDVGTAIYRNEGRRWSQDQEYRKEMSRAWGGKTGPDIAALLADLGFLETQEAEKQKEFKQSYYVPLSISHHEVLGEISKHLDGRNIHSNIIYSVDTAKQVGLVDVLPSNAAKDYALRYLWKSIGLDKDRVVYAGDSGNDLLAFISGFQAIVVGNTADGVKDEVMRRARDKKINDRIYFATHKYVKGVVEGCYHFQLFEG